MRVALRKGAGYFKPERCAARISKEGFPSYEEELIGSVNGWNAGNILIGGLGGFLAVDPATGAMYTLQPKTVEATPEAAKFGAGTSGPEVNLVVEAFEGAKQFEPKTTH